MTGIQPSPEQAAILAAPLEPTRIAAGAGTGKTTTLAMRIRQCTADADRTVLGLTFTNKAAAELAGRVETSESRLVEVKTYHGFAHALLREFGAFAGVDYGTRVIAPAFGRQIMAAALAAVATDAVNATWDGTVQSAVELAARLRENLCTPADLAAAGAEDETIAAKRRDYAALIEFYEAEKRRLGVADYGDLIAKAFEVVDRHPDIGLRIRDRYHAVFLDEYQDTSPAQRMLLQRIFGGGFPVTAVGDVDQTIYEWRGATPRNFEEFPHHFPTVDGRPATSFPLTVNRRSGERILAVANTIRDQADSDPDRPLQPLPGTDPGSVGTRWFATAIEEAGFIADEMTRLHAEGTPWREMAVLVRKNRSIELIRKTLEDADIPVEVVSVGGLLDIPEISDVVSWLRILARPADNAATLRILLGARHRLGLADVRPVADAARTIGGSDDPDEIAGSLVEAAEAVIAAADAGESPFGEDTRALEALKEFVQSYRELLQVAQGSSIVELIRQVLTSTGTWPEIEAMPGNARLSARLNLYRFLDLAEDWSPLEGRPSLESFLAYLDTVADEAAEEMGTAHLSGEDAVALLTVHRAKGLEWDAVFVPTAYRNNFPSKSQGFDDPIGRAEVLPYELRLDGPPDPRLAGTEEKERKVILRELHGRSEWRLAYVAATRARRHLWVTGAWWYGHPAPTKKPAQTSPLYELVASHPAAVDHGADPCPEEPPAVLRPPAGSDGPDPLFDGEGWPEAIRALLSDPDWAEHEARKRGLERVYAAHMDAFQEMLFSLPPPKAPDPDTAAPAFSVTGLVTFATCPRRFYWSFVDPLPRRPSAAAARGVEVHRRIELHNRGHVPLTDVADDLYDDPGTSDEPAASAFAVYRSSRFAGRRPRFVEVPFTLHLSGAVIRGRIDAVYEDDDGTWEVVDFKSGRPSDNPAAEMQLAAYAVATAEGLLGPAPRNLRVTFAYLGGGKLVEQVHEVDDEWVDRARRRIEAAISEVAAERFTADPGPACRSCDFTLVCEAGSAYLAAADDR